MLLTSYEKCLIIVFNVYSNLVEILDARRFWKSSEAIASSYLESMGYRIVDVHRKVVVSGVEVSDVDIVAERGGTFYAIEVKSGAIDFDSLRQAYVNARLLGMKPMVIGRGLADSRIDVVARELGVEVLVLPDLVVTSLNEIREAVYEAVYSALNELLATISLCSKIEEDDLRVLEVLADSEVLMDAATRLGLSEGELASKIAFLREKYLLPRGRYQSLVLVARVLVLCRRMLEASGPAPRR
jgi:predicted RecB family endonuclease